MAHYRDLEIRGEIWRFHIGPSTVEIRYPDDRSPKMLPTQQEIHGLADDEIDPDQGLPPTGPGDVRAYIEKQLAKAHKPS